MNSPVSFPTVLPQTVPPAFSHDSASALPTPAAPTPTPSILTPRRAPDPVAGPRRFARLLILASLVLPRMPALAQEPASIAPMPGTYPLPAIKPASDGAVLDTRGRSRRLAEFTLGRVTVLSFIYTRCGATKACPYATGVLNDLHAASTKDSELAQNLRLVSLSFDPQFDTPTHLARYSSWVASKPAGCPWDFLTTRSLADLNPILHAYNQAVDRKANPADPSGPLQHTLRVFLIDPDGKIRNIYSADTLEPELVLADIRTLIRHPAERPVTFGHPPETLTPLEALKHPGETNTVVFEVASGARVSEILAPGREAFQEVLLLDAPNGDFADSPHDRARIAIRIPAESLHRFTPSEPEDLLAAYTGHRVAVTGRIELENRPDSVGGQRVVIEISSPAQLRKLAQPNRSI